MKALTEWLDRTVDKTLDALRFTLILITLLAVFVFGAVFTICLFTKILGWVFS